jgi:lipopolysaccharide/colanic/teichoic acid biosynthesis glycosyltransferase
MTGTSLLWIAWATTCLATLLAWRMQADGDARVADGQERLLFVGSSRAAAVLVREIETRLMLQWRVLGLVADLTPGETPPIGPWLGSIGELPEIIASTCPTRIVLAPAVRRSRAAEQTLLDARLSGIAAQRAADLVERVTGKLPIERLTPQHLLDAPGFRHADITAFDPMHHIARLYSAVGATVGLAIAAPLLALLAIAIRLDSTGPIIFVQERLGMGGRTFRLYKFRTMRESVGRRSEWVSDNSDRITRVGRWLRRFRLDELPQLVNVLKGDMNLVGPRPHPACNGPLFLARIPHYRLRFAVRPGITGWAQVRYGYANSLDEEIEKMRYDLYYIKHRSIAFDLRIVAATLWTLIFDGRNHEAAHDAPSAVVWSAHWGALR